MDDLSSASGPSVGRSNRRSSFDGGGGAPTHQQRQRVKQDVCAKVLKHLQDSGDEAVLNAGFEKELQAHFARLPTRYALDVNSDRAEDVLTHKRLLEEAASPENGLSFHVRPVHLLVKSPSEGGDGGPDSPMSGSPPAEAGGRLRNYPPPAFGSSPNLEQLALDMAAKDLPKSLPKSAGIPEDEDQQTTSQRSGFAPPHLPLHEVTFSTLDRPKLLSQLSAVLADIGLNIQEAHVFSTVDGYSLDVFVVDGWPTEETEDLMANLQVALNSLEQPAWMRSEGATPTAADSPIPSVPRGGSASATPPGGASLDDPSRVKIPYDGQDDWEIDSSQLVLQQKVASGSFGDLFRGTYCGQDVAIKILKPERLSDTLQQEFAQEVYIMRKVRHKNVVQFIGACTKPPNLSIVTEFMSGGSVYDWLHKQKAATRLPMLLKIAVDVARGMDFLHKNNIIHRDLKAANLLMNENEVVKVADFGVARVQAHGGVMTAETGTYRWMAPEVIEHRPYNHKADVFSFGIVLWELLTGKLPYADLTPLQAAVNVVQKNLRPAIPRGTHPAVADMMERCWRTEVNDRPEFAELVVQLQEILKEVEEESESETRKDKRKGGFFSALKRGSGSQR
eukprot:TRINITY_DN1072_c0_g1_i1.p1 TRINITY_DN1072_c0_g1~~TRINITY_DN1072_c0_g1_i1.p1  ORF type:complete len:618 (-),score=150.57 TRINITY_DN1072_c0_g1_i1:368-2221(-)